MKKLFYFAAAITAAVYSASALSIPEICMTPAEVMSGDKRDSQIGRYFRGTCQE